MITNKSKTILVAVFLATTSLTACGGGSSDSGMLIEGTLTEAGGAAHSQALTSQRSAVLRHGEGERIENVQVCALSECSITDGQGQWGFVIGNDFPGGNVAFSINGHGIETTTTVNIPSGANEVFLDFQHIEGGKVEAHHITVDGETSHHEDDEHAHE